MLNTSDMYVSGGSNDHYSCWTDPVTKFDPSSFYQWEQDNLPVLDLEERTTALWARAGYATSAITGMSFIVSSTAPSTCGNFYTSLSSCLEALPEVINYPLLVEVMNFGDLGELNLSNKIFGPNGSLEIVNRGFSTGTGGSNSEIWNKEIADANSNYSIASAVTLGTHADFIVASLKYNSLTMPSLLTGFHGAASYFLGNGSNILSSFGAIDTRIQGNLTVFTRKIIEGNNNRLGAALADNNPTLPWTTNSNSSGLVAFTNYESNPQAEDLIDTYDASCINELTDAEIVWETPGDATHISVSIGYINKLSSLNITNCHGPVYIRNFTVDGGAWSGTVDHGFNIENSNVFLENCSVSRCHKSGLRAFNSKVSISKAFVAYRNYPFDSLGNRVGEAWTTKLKNENPQDSYGAGILAINSEINFHTDDNRELALYHNSSGVLYADFFSGVPGIGYPGADIPIPGMGSLFCISRNDIGIKGVNSRITGGKTELDGSATISYYDAHQLITELNKHVGIQLDNSVLEHSGRLFNYGNFRGIDAVNSKLAADCVKAQYSQKEGIRLKDSTFTYNKDTYSLYVNNSTALDGSHVHQTSLVENGTHLRLTNSSFLPTVTSGMPEMYEQFLASGSFGVKQDTTDKKCVLPSIILEQGSKLDAVHPIIFNPDAYLLDNTAIYGAAISAKGGSEVTLRGSSKYATKIAGPSTFELQEKKVALFADEGSTIKLHGPTVIGRYAVNMLADNNSKIEVTPQRDHNGSLQVSSYDLTTPANHTMVELHSTRACIVVDHGSQLVLEDLGDYAQFWPDETYGALQIASGLDYVTSADLNYPLYTSAGSIQFYPNPNDSLYYESSPATANISLAYGGADAFSVNGQGKHYYLEDAIGDTANSLDFSSVTLGGMCVRAVNKSNVEVNNVHFPCGFWNASGLVYDAVDGVSEGDNCNRLFIWNIADNSMLNAKYITVSSLHPVDAGYVGPSGVYGAASGAPSGTHDTSTVSILDYYGESNNHAYSRSAAGNLGPFRLFFSTDPAANWLLNNESSLSGLIPQVFSQGYNFSANCIAPGDVSADHMSLIKNNNGVLEASGFYYASSMVFSPGTIKAVLDDSAANSFANAKHNSVGKSGLAKVVSIYYAYRGAHGGDSTDSSLKTHGKGVRSVNNFDLEKDN